MNYYYYKTAQLLRLPNNTDVRLYLKTNNIKLLVHSGKVTLRFSNGLA